MNYKKSTIDILRDLIAAMDFTIEITAITTTTIVLDGRTVTVKRLTVCDVMHAEPGRDITLSEGTYTLRRIDATNRYFYIITTDTLALQSFELYPPVFYHGTPIATGIELNQEQTAADKTPMIWFAEIATDEYFDQDSSLDRFIRGELFFLTQNDPEKWLTDESYLNAVDPMRRLAEHFLADVQASNVFYTDEFKYNLIAYPKFGVYIREKGVLVEKFADKLAGVQLPSCLTVINTYDCPVC